MLPYIIVIFFPNLLYLLVRKKFVFDFFFYLFIALIIVFISLRINIGPDIGTVFAIFKNLSGNFLEYLKHRESFHLILQLLISNLGLDYNSVNTFYAFFSILILLSIFIKKNNKDKIFFLIFLLPFYFLFLNINSPRQSFSIALATFLIFNNFLFDRKIIWKLFLLYLCITTHNSSIILLPVYLLLFINDNQNLVIKIWSNRKILLIITTFVLAIPILLLIPKIWIYFYNHFIVGANYSSPAYYFRSIYFCLFILISFSFLFTYKVNSKSKIIIFYFTFLFFLNYFVSFYNTTVSDRLNYHLFIFSFYVIYLYKDTIVKTSSIKLDQFFLLINSLFFIVWMNFSKIFETWTPYNNILFQLIK